MTNSSKGDGDDVPFVRDERFRKAERLLCPREFSIVRRRGARFVTDCLVIIAAPGPHSWSRVGITVSRKVGNAVVRNRVKRRLREAFRRNKRALPAGYDFVWIARNTAAPTDFAQLATEAIEGSQRAAHRLKCSTRHVRPRK